MGGSRVLIERGGRSVWAAAKLLGKVRQMERITESNLAAMAGWLTAAMRESGRITEGERVGLVTPWSFRVWAIVDVESGGVHTLDGVGGSRRELWNAGRAMLWAIEGGR